MVIRYVFRLCDMDVQFDNNETGIIIVVSKTKYIDRPSTPKLKIKIAYFVVFLHKLKLIITKIIQCEYN